MFSLHSFKDKFEIHPRYLSKDWKDNILNLVKTKKNRTISNLTGAILDVVDVVVDKYLDSFNSKTFANVKYDALSFIPDTNKEYTGVISMILPFGILIESEGLVKIMIQPSNMPEEYKFNRENKTFENGKKCYSKGDKIRFKIMSTKYKTGEINCIGSMKDIEEYKEPEEVFVEDSDVFMENTEDVFMENTEDVEETDTFIEEPDTFE